VEGGELDEPAQRSAARGREGDEEEEEGKECVEAGRL